MTYNENNRVRAMEWWNSLSPLQKTEYATDRKGRPMPCSTGREIETIYWKYHPTDTKMYKDFDEFYSHHPYQKNLCYSEEDWKIEMFEKWSQDNDILPQEIYGEGFKEVMKEETSEELLAELWDWTTKVHPWLTKSASPDSLFGKIKIKLNEKVPA